MRWQTFVRSHVFYSECAHNRQTGRVRRPRVQTLLLLTNGASHGVSRISIGRPQIKISPRVLVILDLHHGRVGCDAGVPGLRSPWLPEVRSSAGNAIIGCALPLYPQLGKKRHPARSRRLVSEPDSPAPADSNRGDADLFTGRYEHARTGRAGRGLKVINFAWAPARFRAFPHDTGIAPKGDKPVACVGPILKLFDGYVIAGSRPVRAVKRARGILTMCGERLSSYSSGVPHQEQKLRVDSVFASS
jgi:hypothetical protein